MNATYASVLEQLGISKSLLAARNLHEYPQAEHLVVAEVGDDGKTHLLVPTAAGAWRELRNAAREDQITVFIVSAFRSIERQEAIIRQKLNAGANIEDILKLCAAPGHSEHHTGRAVDIGTPDEPLLDISFGGTSACRWLVSYAHCFGFHLSYPEGNSQGYQYEPWH